MSIMFYQGFFYDQVPEVAIVSSREFCISLQSVDCGPCMGIFITYFKVYAFYY